VPLIKSPQQHSSTAIPPPSFPSHPGTSIPIDCRSEARWWQIIVVGLGRSEQCEVEVCLSSVFHYETSRHKCRLTRCHVDQVTPIDVLPDDVLLVIFGFCVAGVGNQDRIRAIEGWQSLVHVCRGWRSLVFGSPQRLNLRLVCTPRTLARKSLDVWPALRLLIQGTIISTSSVDSIVVALGHSDRVFRIDLLVTGGPQWDKVSTTMQVPFPALTDLILQSKDEMVAVIPDTFLGGSAPRLRYLELECIPFPGIPKLLLSATHLVYLYLHHIPRSGYISPEEVVTCLSVLTSLDTLSLQFQSSRSRPNRESRRPPPVTRSILPDLTTFRFNGVSEYLEDLVARIDAPRLHNLFIALPHQINFDTPHLVQFIHRTPRFEEPNEAIVRFDFYHAGGSTSIIHTT
jgi:hypothetical protein